MLRGCATTGGKTRVAEQPPQLRASLAVGLLRMVCDDDARLKLAALPRNSSATRIRNRCELTGRPRAFYRKLKMSRIALRELGSRGQIPGLVKSSW